MLEPVNDLLESVLASPWVYLAITVVSLVDAFFPPIPSDPVVIAAVAGGRKLVWVVLLAAAGAFIGDHTSYTLGRFLGTPACRRLLRGERGQRAHAWAQRTLRERGGLVLVAARLVPGGRMAATLSAGTLDYPLPRFAAFDALAVLIWATYAGLIGHFAGRLFREDQLTAIAFGLALSLALTAVVETGRFVIRWRRGHRRSRQREAAAR